MVNYQRQLNPDQISPASLCIAGWRNSQFQCPLYPHSDTCSYVFPSCRRLQRRRFCYRRLRRLPETQVFLHGQLAMCFPRERDGVGLRARAPRPPLALGRWPRCRPAAPAVAIRHRTRTRAKNDTDTRARPRSGARRRRTREAGPGDAAPLRSRAVTGVRAPARHSAVGLGR